METIQILPKTSIAGELHVPSSKSYAQRAIAIGSLSQNKVSIYQVGNNDDVIVAQKIAGDLGAQFVQKDNALFFHKGIDIDNTKAIEINCGESGLSTRLFSAFSLLFGQTYKITGEGSITDRTMEMVIKGLQQFGKTVESVDSHLPIVVSGETKNREIEIDGSISSQFLTGLLIVSPFLPFDTSILVHNLKSRPYIEMTLDLLKAFGVSTIETDDFKSFHIKGNQGINQQIEYTVEGDWSSAAFMIVAGVIGGKVKLRGLNRESKQGDRAVLEAVQRAGAKVKWENNVLIVEKGIVQPFEFDATECPDLFPALVVLAAYASGQTIIKGVGRLKHKESNRAIALQKECSKVGLSIQLQEDIMIIHGKGKPQIENNVSFSSHQDHRMAMGMSLFSIGAKYPIIIDNFRSIDKSYPNFYKDLAML